MNTRTAVLWHNNGAEQFSLAVNPASIRVTRPNVNRALSLAMGGEAAAWGGRGLREVALETFLPGEASPFFQGTAPSEILDALKRWQDSGDPIRLILSGTDINDAFLIEDVTEVFREGDGDVGLVLKLREYRFASELAAAAGGGVVSGAATSVSQAREDERTQPETYAVQKGDTLWALAGRFYGDCRRWSELAAKNGVKNPRNLQVGQVLTL